MTEEVFYPCILVELVNPGGDLGYFSSPHRGLTWGGWWLMVLIIRFIHRTEQVIVDIGDAILGCLAPADKDVATPDSSNDLEIPLPYVVCSLLEFLFDTHDLANLVTG